MQGTLIHNRIPDLSTSLLRQHESRPFRGDVLPMLLCRMSFTAFLLATTHPLLGHEDPHRRIEQLAYEIASDPDDAALYLKRGELHRLASHWELALADFDRVRELNPNHESIELFRGRVQFDAGHFQAAEESLDRFLEGHPDHAVALAVRARTRRERNKPLEAVDDYDRALALVGERAPDLHLERASALAEAGQRHLVSAVAGLDEALRKLGPLVVLESKAIDLELQMRNYDGALARIDGVLVRMRRKEAWLVRRAEALERAGMTEQARNSYAEALASIESLPPYQRRVPASKALESRLRSVLNGGER